MTNSNATDLIRWGAASDPGRVRTNNEDAFVVADNVWAVADGMGGHQAGEVASDIAVSTMRDRLGIGAASVDVAVAAFVEANASIFHGAHTNAEQRGMGTTLSALVMLNATAQEGEAPPSPQRLALLNVGDSRTYLWRQNVLHRASIDHSYVQELVATGHITEVEARTHPRRNIVTRALGIEPTVRVDTWTFPLVRGDRFVICSDGLVDEVDDDEIRDIIANTDDPQTAAEQLVTKANENGGRDNVTVIVLDVIGGSDTITADPSLATSELQQVPTWNAADEPVETPSLIEADEALPPPQPVAAVADADADAPKRRSVGKLLAMLLVAGAVAFGVTFLAVSLSGDDDPAPSTTTNPTTTSRRTTTTSSPTTTATTATTTPATGTPTTASGGPSTSQP
jgi:PPM family protein phosphatase